MPSNLSKTLYSVNISPSLLRGEGGVTGNFEDLVENLAVVDSYDGSEQCTFELTTNTKDKGSLAKLFYQLLMSDVRIDTGNPVFRGFVYQLIFSAGNASRRITLEDITNEVSAHHTGGIATVTVSGITDESQIRFGSRVYDQRETSDLSLADATLIAEGRITRDAFTPVRMIGRDNRTRLRVLAAGYLSILSWCTTSLSAGISVKDAFEQIIDDCGQGIITYDVDKIMDNGQTWNSNVEGTGLDLIRRLEQILDTSGKPWRFYIDKHNKAHWEPIDFNPAYEIKEGISEMSKGIFRAYYGGRKIEPFEPLAGRVIRDATYPLERAYPLSPFQSEQDGYIRRVKFDALGNPSIEEGDLIDFGTTNAYGT